MNASTHYAECWRDHHDCAVAEVERLRSLATTALIDWARTYASDCVSAESLAETMGRIEEGGGVLAYIAGVRRAVDGGGDG